MKLCLSLLVPAPFSMHPLRWMVEDMDLAGARGEDIGCKYMWGCLLWFRPQ